MRFPRRLNPRALFAIGGTLVIVLALISFKVVGGGSGATTAMDAKRAAAAAAHQKDAATRANERANGSHTGTADSSRPGSNGGVPGSSSSSYTPPPPRKRPASFYRSLYDFVNVMVPEDESWGGADCNPAHSGSHCTILFEGITFLAHDTKGTIEFQVQEDANPLFRTIDSMPAKQYRTPVYRWVPYQVPKGVQLVTVKAVLKNSKGVPVAFGHPQSYPIR
ncbi:MAG: hypothetical protein NVSMB57_06200 [Actinomycetota bacterium]